MENILSNELNFVTYNYYLSIKIPLLTYLLLFSRCFIITIVIDIVLVSLPQIFSVPCVFCENTAMSIHFLE